MAMVAVMACVAAMGPHSADANACKCLCCADERTCLHTKKVTGCVDCTEDQCERWFPQCAENADETQATCVKTDSNFNRASVYIFLILVSGLIVLAVLKDHVPFLQQHVRVRAHNQ